MVIFGKKEEKQEVLKFKELKIANKNYVPIMLVLDAIIEGIIQETINFENSNKTMTDIDLQAKEAIKNVQNSREFAALMKDQERKVELKESILQLSKTRATRWEAQAFFAIQMIQEKAKFLKRSPVNKDIVETISKAKVWK